MSLRHTVDLLYGNICQKLGSQTETFRRSLETVPDSYAYSQLVAALIQDLLTGEVESQLWFAKLGFQSCLAIIPSSLFALPVSTFFRRLPEQKPQGLHPNGEEDKKLQPRFRRRQWTSTSPFSFLGDDVSPDRIVEFHFVGSRLPKASGFMRLEHPHVFFITDEFIDFLIDSEYNAPFSESELYNSDDPRLTKFLKRHGKSLMSLLNHEYPVGEIGPISSIDPAYSALWEIYDLYRQSPLLARYAYLIPGVKDDGGRGTFCFFFARRLGSLERALLRFMSDRLLLFVRNKDREAGARRIAAQNVILPFSTADFHSFRNAMGNTLNHLLTLRANEAISSSGRLTRHVEEAVSSHQGALQQIERLRVQSAKSHSWGSKITLEKLLRLWISRWKPPSDWRFQLDLKQQHRRFSLPAPEADLAAALYQFLETPGVTVVPEEEAYCDYLEEPFIDTVLHLSIDDRGPMLRILVYNATGLSGWARFALRAVTVFDRLPSSKPDGGKGILSSIITIRERFRGSCVCQERPAGQPGDIYWKIAIPIQLTKRRPRHVSLHIGKKDEHSLY